ISTGHTPLQSHLFRLQVVDTRICPQCGDAPETVAYYLLRCRAFVEARHAHLNLSFLFSSPLALALLFKFIRASGRFAGSIG
ncbi:hypothetical protein BDV93DRAFT_454638, partial [Ceratobasidium sp. AG-I]